MLAFCRRHRLRPLGFGLEILLQLLVGDFLGQRLRRRVRSIRPSTTSSMRISSRSSCRTGLRISAIVVGSRNGLIMCFQASSMRFGDLDFALARQQFVEPNSRMYMAPDRWCARIRNRTGWQRLLRLLDHVFMGTTAGVASFISSVSASGALVRNLDAHVVCPSDEFSICSASSMSSGRWSLISA